MSTLSDFVGGSAQLWVSGATYAQGKFAISPTDFTSYIRKIAGAGTTDPASDTTNWQQFGQSAIKRILRGTISIGSGSGTATITACNMAKTELRNMGINDTSSARLELTNSTTITMYGANGMQAGWELTERF